MASQCYIVGRIEDAFRYIDATDQVTASDGDEVPHGRAAWAGGGYLAMGQVERWVDWCRNELARGRGDRPFTWACLSLH
jgi:hypothetical protein